MLTVVSLTVVRLTVLLVLTNGVGAGQCCSPAGGIGRTVELESPLMQPLPLFLELLLELFLELFLKLL